MIEFEGQAAFIDIALDVTERKQAEQEREAAFLRLEAANREMQRSRDTIRTLFDGISDGLLMIDREGLVLAVNQAAARLFGCSPKAFINQSWADCCQQPETYLGSVVSYFPGLWVLETVQDGKTRHRHEHFTHPNGISYTFDMQAWSIAAIDQQETNSAEVDQVILRITDVTEKLRLEALMIENERLSVGRELTQIVAHEVNTPLQSIMVLLDLIASAGDDERHALLMRAQHQAGRIGTILHRLSESYHPQMTGVLKLVDVQSVISDVLESTRKKLMNQSIKQHINLTSDILPVAGDPEQMYKMLLNLVYHAMDMMPQGGDLYVQTKVQMVPWNQHDATEAKLVIVEMRAVSSASEGTDDAAMPASLTAREQSLDSGLFISRKIIAQIGGALSIDRHAETGTVFTIHLPMQRKKGALSE
jgi:PAS domain S-box-containing protein